MSQSPELSQWKIRQDGFPKELLFLLKTYPRSDWESHEGFHQLTAQWLRAHQIFRDLARTIRTDTEQFLNNSKDPQEYRERLSYHGSALVGNLHGHHTWEDHTFFPELSAADLRFDAGIAILEKDHQVLDKVLNEFTRSANRTMRQIRDGHQEARSAAGELHTYSNLIESLLHRHLNDEEELVVPIVLHYRLRG